MPFNLLLSASPSFINDDLLKEKLDFYLQNRPDYTLHVQSQKHFTQAVKRYSSKVIVHARDFIMDGHKTTQVIYKEQSLSCDAVLIFWDGETKNEAMLIKMCQEINRRYKVVPFESLKQQLEKMPKAERRKKITVPITNESKQRYYAAHEQWYKREYQAAYNDGFYTKPKMPVINSGSRMDFFIINFLVWIGWNATKVHTMGRKLPNGKWMPSTTKKALRI